jgi:RimJ/RimL family protein N-acetyltransferase
MRLSGQRCDVRVWRASDAESIVLHANDPNVAKQLRDRFPHPYTRAHALAFLKPALAAAHPTNFCIDVNGEAVGGIGFVCGTDVERYSAEIGYWLSEAYWRQGIVTEALMLVSSHAFATFNVLRLFALPFADNVASIRVLEKAGYVREGILRSSSVKYGQCRDQIMYARINTGWKMPGNPAPSSPAPPARGGADRARR